MKCPKCPSSLSTSKTKDGIDYHWCRRCKGLWTSLLALRSIFVSAETDLDLQQHLAAAPFAPLQLENANESSLACPTCSKSLLNGLVKNSDLEIEQCLDCQSYFFDPGEMNRLLRIMKVKTPSPGSGHRRPKDFIVELPQHCPVCIDQPLWGSKEFPDKFQACLNCHGLMTKAETLQQLLGRSIFSPGLFTFHNGDGAARQCRHCDTVLARGDTSCSGCQQPVLRVQCTACNARMSEYHLNSIAIERCQMCNRVWLDNEEFEQIMIAVPDLKKPSFSTHPPSPRTGLGPTIFPSSTSYARQDESDVIDGLLEILELLTFFL